MNKIGVLTGSLARSLSDPRIGLDGVLDFLVRNDITGLEVNNWSFLLDGAPATPSIWLFRHVVPLVLYGTRGTFKPRLFAFEEFMQRVHDRHLAPILLGIDGTFFMWHAGRMHARHVKAWLDAAHGTGIPAARVFVGWAPLPSSKKRHLERAVRCIAPLVALAADRNMQLLFENYTGLSNDPTFVTELVDAIGSDHLGFIVDFGNCSPKQEVYEMIVALKDCIKMAHAKTFQFNEQGDEVHVDYRIIAERVKQTGFNGPVLIEYMGRGNDLDGTLKTRDLLNRHFP